MNKNNGKILVQKYFSRESESGRVNIDRIETRHLIINQTF